MSDPGADRAGGPEDRRDPMGKRALFEAPVDAPADQLRPGPDRSGRDALFSAGPRESGTVVVECSACSSRTRVVAFDAARRLMSLSLYSPLLHRRHPHLIRCPACHDRTWCRIRWTA